MNVEDSVDEHTAPPPLPPPPTPCVRLIDLVAFLRSAPAFVSAGVDAVERFMSGLTAQSQRLDLDNFH